MKSLTRFLPVREVRGRGRLLSVGPCVLLKGGEAGAGDEVPLVEILCFCSALHYAVGKWVTFKPLSYLSESVWHSGGKAKSVPIKIPMVHFTL